MTLPRGHLRTKRLKDSRRPQPLDGMSSAAFERHREYSLLHSKSWRILLSAGLSAWLGACASELTSLSSSAPDGSSCGDGDLQRGEACELGGRDQPLLSDGSRGLAAGTQYDEWNCNPETCERRYVDTPCSSVGWNVDDCPTGFCDGTTCRPADSERCEAWGIENPIVECEIEGTWSGLCGLTLCFPSCESDADCSSNTRCTIMYEGFPNKTCR